jgi:hypothetical protein
MRKTILIAGLALGVTAALSAQTKFSAKMQCAKGDPEVGVPVGDHPGHVMTLAHSKCTWSEGELGGAKLETTEDTASGEAHGNTSNDHGYGVVSVAGGDKAYVTWQGKTTLKDNKPEAGKGTWYFHGGTGNLKGLKGKGTWESTYAADGTGTVNVEGEYTVGGGAAKAKK